MGKRLFIAEKPSVAMEFAKVLGASKRNNGYIEGDNDVITWCVGHLVTMSYPDAYDESLKSWKMETLPFIPDSFIYEVIDSVKDQFAVVSKLMKRSDISVIYYSGDSAREGEYIQRLVRMMVKPNPGVEERRVWIDSQTEDEIKRGIREAKLLSEYDLLSDAAYMRAAEDYLFGINLSRAYTIKYGNLYKSAISSFNKESIAIGRVMTCVLGLVVERERLIKSTKEIPFYGIKANIGNGVSVDWKGGPQSEFLESPLLHKEGAFKNKEDAERFMQKLATIGQLVLMEKKEDIETRNAPLLYNLAELQNECSQALKISPDKTLEIVQFLYEQKMITYPRTDARVLSTAIAATIERNVRDLMRLNHMTKAAEGALSGCSRIASSKYTDDSKISDHYAIIPTGKGTENYGGLSEQQRIVYDMIIKRFLAIFYPSAKFKKVSVDMYCNTELFNCSAKMLIEEGWMQLYEKESGNPALVNALLGLQQGQVYPATFSVTEGKTAPPKRFSSGSMILTMENAGQLIEDPELRAQIKQNGIGTSATRAEVIKKLIANQYIELNAKTQILTPGKRGEVIYDIVKAITPSLLRPEMTANWEKGLSQVENGVISKDAFFEKLKMYVAREVNAVKESDENAIKALFPDVVVTNGPQNGYSAKTKPKFKSSGKSTMPKDCPHCGRKLKEFDWGTTCFCGVKIPKAYFGLVLTEKQQADLLYKGITEMIDGFTKKDGSGTYSAKLKADDDWKISKVFK